MHDAASCKRFLPICGGARLRSAGDLFVECRGRRNPYRRAALREAPAAAAMKVLRGDRLRSFPRAPPQAPRRIFGLLFAEAQNFFVVSRPRHKQTARALTHQIVPAAWRPPVDAICTTHDQPVRGAGHGDVKEPAVFVLRLGKRAGALQQHCATSSALRPAQITAPSASCNNRGGRGPAAASWCRRGSRPALRGPWRRAPS